jgi:hypothetical protein
MPASGYSQTPLVKKLGIKPPMKIFLINAPTEYFNWFPAGIRDQVCSKKEQADLVHLFIKNEKGFRQEMKQLTPRWKQKTDLIIWVSWYKRSAKVPTDINEDLIRAYALQHGLVDIKVCAISEIWSGLKLVVPLKQRMKM